MPQGLVNDRAPVGAAKALGVNCCAVVTGVKAGRLSCRMRKAGAGVPYGGFKRKSGVPNMAHPEWGSEELDTFRARVPDHPCRPRRPLPRHLPESPTSGIFQEEASWSAPLPGNWTLLQATPYRQDRSATGYVLPCPSRSGVGRKWAVSTLSWIIGVMFGPNTS